MRERAAQGSCQGWWDTKGASKAAPITHPLPSIARCRAKKASQRNTSWTQCGWNRKYARFSVSRCENIFNDTGQRYECSGPRRMASPAARTSAAFSNLFAAAASLIAVSMARSCSARAAGRRAPLTASRNRQAVINASWSSGGGALIRCALKH